MKITWMSKIFSATGLILLASSSASASGFKLQEQNIKDLGTAYAGAGSIAEDASTNFYNSAGLHLLPGTSIALSSAFMSSSFKPTITTATTQAGAAVAGLPSIVKDEVGIRTIPSLHLSKKIDERISVGFSIASPYGYKSEYPNDAATRYMATQSKLTTMLFSASVSYKLTDSFYVGMGPDFIRTKSDLNWIYNAGADVNVNVDGKDSTLSGHIGVLYVVSDRMQIGLNYQHQHSANLEGSITAPNTTGRDANMNIRLPSSIRYSITSQHNENWKIMADVEWTWWSSIKDVNINYTTNANAAASFRLKHDYKNSLRFAIGMHYKYSDSWLIKFGAAYDKSPSNKNNVILRVPDNHQITLALGASYRFSNVITADFGYRHTFYKKVNINEGPLGANPQANQIVGRGTPKVDVVGVQLTWNLV